MELRIDKELFNKWCYVNNTQVWYKVEEWPIWRSIFMLYWLLCRIVDAVENSLPEFFTFSFVLKKTINSVHKDFC